MASPYYDGPGADWPLFATTCRDLGLVPTPAGDAHFPCPSCGHRVVPGQTHFHITPRGGHCFACGWGAGLVRLRALLGLDARGGAAATGRPGDGGGGRSSARPATLTLSGHPPAGRETAPPRPPVAPSPPLPFDRLLAAYARHPGRLAAWQAYRPLTAATVERWELGLGVLPRSRCPHARLVYPVREGGRVVALRGRAVACACGKLLQAAGSRTALFNVDGLRPGAPVVIAENPIDAILFMQEAPDHVALALGGAGLWQPTWAARVAAARPGPVLVWLDNDLAGQAHGAFRDVLGRRWRATHAGPPPRAAGPRIVGALRRAGVDAHLVRWPPGTPEKHDLGAWLMNMIKGDPSWSATNGSTASSPCSTRRAG